MTLVLYKERIYKCLFAARKLSQTRDLLPDHILSAIWAYIWTGAKELKKFIMFLARKSIIRRTSICNRPRHKLAKITMSAYIRMFWRRFQSGTPYSRFRTVNNGMMIGSLTLTCHLSYIERKRVAEEKKQLQERAYQLKKDQILKYQQMETELRKGGD